MTSLLAQFERIVRQFPATEARQGDSELLDPAETHPFETRNIHPDLPIKVRKLFDDGHPNHAVFEAFKYIEKEIKRLSGVRKTGFPLMMDAFNENAPKIQLNDLQTESEVDEQSGFRHLFAGAVAGIRNPRGHEVDLVDNPDEALDYLALVSLLLRKLDDCGVR
ncbi:TIGR02391 family protein [Georgenia sp. SYP-B2076]|uniref:TIGR02391 family protein n=1 Tax=Georgenia sp. SYP-B2076 TaxID=2495881 RepID=UPI000F8EF291|nr:TIGR02391 family protein [Georgenia sp. SYP-B2076]